MTTALALLLSMLFAADVPLAIAKVAGGPPYHVELRNTGTKPVNAWSFAVTSPNANGGIHREFHSADVYMSEVTGGLQGADPNLRPLQPGESRAVPVDALPPEASLQVIAVVLEDNTAYGDEQTIESLFQTRIAERDQLVRVVDIFDASIESQHGKTALEDLKRRMDADTTANETVPHRSARFAVDGWLQRIGPANEDDIDRSVRTYAAFVARQYEVAVKHAERKASPGK
jgi:hypothetical protein